MFRTTLPSGVDRMLRVQTVEHDDQVELLYASWTLDATNVLATGYIRWCPTNITLPITLSIHQMMRPTRTLLPLRFDLLDPVLGIPESMHIDTTTT